MLWPLLIALCFVIFGTHEYIPLVLNILACVALLFYASEALRRVNCPGLWRMLVLVGIVLLVPLCAIACVAMEHSLQILLTFAFVDLAARLLMDGSQSLTGRRTPVWLCVMGVLMVMTRYEGLFLITGAGLLLLCRGRWKLAVILGVVSVLPIVLLGLYSLHKGWYFLPNSLILKGNVNPLTPTLAGLIQYFSKGYNMMMSEPHMPAVVLAATVALIGTLQRRWNRGPIRLWSCP